MPSGVLQRSQRLAIGQDNRPIEALIPRHYATPQQNLEFKLMLAVIGGILPPNFQPWRANGRSLFNLSRSVSSNGPVLFERPARYTRAYSRRRRPPPAESRGQ